jgi:5-methyltetrahydrofolate--homocysteine methyltransferase
MHALLDRLRSGEILVGDGAWGTMLMARGLKPGQAPEVFNLTRPEVLEDIARLYLDAGADLITTNTFGGSPVRLRQSGLEARTEEVNRAAVDAVRRAVGIRAYVSASVGPSGHVLKPYGDADPAEIRAGFERQIRALAGAGVDLVCVETMTDLAEAVLALQAARKVAPGVAVVATMTFEPTRRGFFTVMGNSVDQAIRGLLEAGADIVGSNCGNGVQIMVEIAREFRARTPGLLAIQSNAGLPEHRAGEIVYPDTPGFMAEQAAVLAELGVAIIGGCCGTTPAHIQAIRRVVDARQPRSGRS